MKQSIEKSMNIELKNTWKEILKDCTLCPRMCHVDRTKGQKGICGMGAELMLSRAMLHEWEEDCISGTNGSGGVFFTGCNMRCIFCQNHKIAVGQDGIQITGERLAEIFLELQQQGAHNINLVTPTHFVPQICYALDLAREKGLHLPVVYNTSGYECAETIKMLDGYVDIYLPDFKYMDVSVAGEYSKAPDYPQRAKEALAEMVRQVGACEFDEVTGLIKKGVIVRHLVLPGHVANSKQVLNYLFETYGNSIYYSIMSQYTPMPHMSEHPLLKRKVTRREYNKVLDYALELGIENGFMQDGKVAKESFIPAFDGAGVIKEAKNIQNE